MNLFFVVPEIAPIVKTGGLGDVVGALPKYLKKLGHDVRVICPAYGAIKDRTGWVGYETPLEVWVGHERRLCKVWESRLPGSEVPIYYIEYNLFFARQEIYDSPWGACQDNDHRYTFFTRAAINLCNYLKWYPDVFHCHDWMTGLLPVYLNTHDKGTRVAEAATLMTIHNLEFQGNFYAGLIEWAHLKRQEVFHPTGLAHAGGINLLKGGLFHSTKINTVSPTYAEEIKTKGKGCGLEDVLKFRGADLMGLLNGIDTEVWNPATDKEIPANFTAENLAGKAVCKQKLQEAFGLEQTPNKPIFGLVARLTSQKGIDTLNTALPRLMNDMQIQVVVLGTGDRALQDSLTSLAQKYPGRVGVHIGFDNNKAKLIYAGSDSLLIPSRFEPCGLTQMYAMRYGTLPLARATGGLADTIDQYQEGQGKGNGFLFADPTAEALYYTMGWACATWYDRKEEWKKLQQNAMAKNFSWEYATRQYEQLYAWAVEARTGRRMELAAEPSATNTASATQVVGAKLHSENQGEPLLAAADTKAQAEEVQVTHVTRSPISSGNSNMILPGMPATA